MARLVALLRGINIGPRNRIAMADLRALLEGGGFGEVRTYLQSGNAVLSSRAAPERVARSCERLIAEQFGLEIAVVVRTRDELAKVVERNPLADVADDPKRYQVAFLAAKLPREAVVSLAAAAAAGEKLVVIDREAYAWHPAGIARSALGKKLAGRDLGVTATARNWTTVTKLLQLADE